MLVDEIGKLVDGDVLNEEQILNQYSEDYSIFRVKPEVVVFPKSVEDLKKLVKFVAAKTKAGEKISLTARSAGTDMSGGPLNESIIVSFTKYFNHIREISKDPSTRSSAEAHSKSLGQAPSTDSGQAYTVVEPGVYFRDLEKELVKRELLYPAYPASKDLCAVGGMVANNSGGEKTLFYGKTEDYVQGVSIVLADGEEHYFKPLAGRFLEEKLREKSMEGDIYRKLYRIIEDNYELIQKAKPSISKNSAGYSLWNVWDRKTFDVTKLIVGSQGTLGLLTAAKLKLVPAPKYSRLVVVFSRTLKPIPDLVRDLLRLNPESIESYDDKTFGLAVKFFPAMLKLMKGSIVKLIFNFLPEIGMILRGGQPKMVLLISFTAQSENELNEKVEQAMNLIKKYPVLARNVRREAEAQEYWTIRRQSFNLLHSHVKGLYAAAFIDDVIVDPKYMPEFLPQVNEILDRYKRQLIYTIAGHPGNGNFHIIPLVNLKDPETRRIIPIVTEEVYRLVFKYGGSITAEHNDGLIRTPYLEEMYGRRVVALFEEVKNIFDPLGIFNPGKKVFPYPDYSFRHLRT